MTKSSLRAKNYSNFCTLEDRLVLLFLLILHSVQPYN